MENPAGLPVLPPIAENPLRTIEDLGRALAAAAVIGFLDNNRNESKKLRRTGFWLAQRLCRPGAWTKRHEKVLKSVYLAGFDHAVAVGRGVPRKPRKRAP